MKQRTAVWSLLHATETSESNRGARDRLRRRDGRDPRPLHRQPRVPGDRTQLRWDLARVALVGPERVRDRLRVAPDPVRPPRRPVEPEGWVPARGRDLHDRLGPVRCSGRRRVARRRSGPTGDRGCAADACVARPAARGVSARTARRCGPDLGRDVGCRCRARARHRRSPGHDGLAADLPRQPSRRRGRARCRPPLSPGHSPRDGASARLAPGRFC